MSCAPAPVFCACLRDPKGVSSFPGAETRERGWQLWVPLALGAPGCPRFCPFHGKLLCRESGCNTDCFSAPPRPLGSERCKGVSKEGSEVWATEGTGRSRFGRVPFLAYWCTAAPIAPSLGEGRGSRAHGRRPLSEGGLSSTKRGPVFPWGWGCPQRAAAL